MLRYILLMALAPFYLPGFAQQTTPALIRKLVNQSAYNIHPVFIKGGAIDPPPLPPSKGPEPVKQEFSILPDFYLNQYEVCVADYRRFYQEHKDQATDTSYHILYPDTLGFFKVNGLFYNEPYTKAYFWHPKYQNYPIVCISRQNAVAYCKWLEAKLRKESIAILGKDIIKEIRLPSQTEWARAAGNFNVDSMVRQYLKNDCRNMNTGDIVTAQNQVIAAHSKDGYLYTNPVNEVEKNKAGLYNMLGNVAEFTSDTLTSRESVASDEGPENGSGAPVARYVIIAGSSWNDDLKFINPHQTRVVSVEDKPSYVGFRYVIEFR